MPEWLYVALQWITVAVAIANVAVVQIMMLYVRRWKRLCAVENAIIVTMLLSFGWKGRVLTAHITAMIEAALERGREQGREEAREEARRAKVG